MIEDIITEVFIKTYSTVHPELKNITPKEVYNIFLKDFWEQLEPKLDNQFYTNCSLNAKIVKIIFMIDLIRDLDSLLGKLLNKYFYNNLYPNYYTSETDLENIKNNFIYRTWKSPYKKYFSNTNVVILFNPSILYREITEKSYENFFNVIKSLLDYTLHVFNNIEFFMKAIDKIISVKYLPNLLEEILNIDKDFFTDLQYENPIIIYDSKELQDQYRNIN